MSVLTPRQPAVGLVVSSGACAAPQRCSPGHNGMATGSGSLVSAEQKAEPGLAARSPWCHPISRCVRLLRAVSPHVPLRAPCGVAPCPAACSCSPRCRARGAGQQLHVGAGGCRWELARSLRLGAVFTNAKHVQIK